MADIFQGRWAKLLVAMYGSGLEAYAADGSAEPPVSLGTFQKILELGGEVDAMCVAVKKPPLAMRLALRGLGKHLLNVRLPST